MPPGDPLPPELVAEFELWVREGASLPADRSTIEKKPLPSLWSLKKPRRRVTRRHGARLGPQRYRSLHPEPSGSQRSRAVARGRQANTDPPGDIRFDGPAADGRGGRPLRRRHLTATLMNELVDRLLASPHYGERWGRHWLDVARYADSVNDSVNAGQRYPWSYTYRDWVIRAFNEDLPYDRFVLYQLAADRVPAVEPRHLAALGFLSLGREFPKSYAETVDDRIDAVARGMLGLTVACARCHDHKFDPIPTTDYYSLYSILSNIRRAQRTAAAWEARRTHAEATGCLPGAARPNSEGRSGIPCPPEQRRWSPSSKRRRPTTWLPRTMPKALSNPEVEELVRDRQLNQHVLARWRKFLRESKASGEPVFRLWHAAAAIPRRSSRRGGRGTRRSRCPLYWKRSSAVEPISSLRDLAAAYAAASRNTIAPSLSPIRNAEQLRAVLRGPTSPVDVPRR